MCLYIFICGVIKFDPLCFFRQEERYVFSTVSLTPVSTPHMSSLMTMSSFSRGGGIYRREEFEGAAKGKKTF